MRSCKLPKAHSFFLFGARGTGKSTLIRNLFPQALVIDLLIPEVEDQLSRSPSFLLEQLHQLQRSDPTQQWIFIDEVQKVPALLDIVHKPIEEKHFEFALSGSSSRKLKRGKANLLAGRALLCELFPYTSFERFMVVEIYRLIKYHQQDWEIFYLRTKDDAEIDLIIDRPGASKILIEIKSSTQPLTQQDEKLKSFAALVHSFKDKEAFVLGQCPDARLVDGIRFLHWRQGLEQIGLLKEKGD